MLEPMVLVLGAETLLFVLTMALANREKTRLAGEYAGIAFHLLLLSVISSFPSGVAGQGSGIGWVVCDVVASVGLLWTARDQADVGRVVFKAVRMAGHLFAAVWITLVSVHLGGAALIVGAALALGFAIYTLAAGRLNEKTLAAPGLLLIIWFVLLARHAAYGAV